MKYTVQVKPGSAREEVLETAPGELIVRTRKRAHDGEANKAVVELLAEHFKVAKSHVAIVRGQTARIKLVEIS